MIDGTAAFLAILSSEVAWAFCTSRSFVLKLGRSSMVKPKNLARELAIGMLLATLVAALVVHLAGGLVVLRIPWSPIPSVLPGFALVVPLGADPDDPGDGGDDGDGPGKDDEDDKRDPDIDVRVWNEDHSKVRLLVTLAGAARTQLQERVAEWLWDVSRRT